MLYSVRSCCTFHSWSSWSTWVASCFWIFWLILCTCILIKCMGLSFRNWAYAHCKRGLVTIVVICYSCYLWLYSTWRDALVSGFLVLLPATVTTHMCTHTCNYIPACIASLRTIREWRQKPDSPSPPSIIEVSGGFCFFLDNNLMCSFFQWIHGFRREGLTCIPEV